MDPGLRRDDGGGEVSAAHPIVIPAEAGIQTRVSEDQREQRSPSAHMRKLAWVPAFAGMTLVGKWAQ
jgi:hypothetical protein